MSSSYEIVLTESQYQDLASRHDENVAQKVVERLNTKQKELEWVESHDQLTKRFQSFFGKDGVHFAEPGFEAHNNEWRAILILIRKADTFIFHRAVKKHGTYTKSRQKDMIHNLQSNPNDAEEKALNLLLKHQSGQVENLIH